MKMERITEIVKDHITDTEIWMNQPGRSDYYKRHGQQRIIALTMLMIDLLREEENINEQL